MPAIGQHEERAHAASMVDKDGIHYQVNGYEQEMKGTVEYLELILQMTKKQNAAVIGDVDAK